MKEVRVILGGASAPSERGSADSENNVSEQALIERARLTAEDIRTQELSNAQTAQDAPWLRGPSLKLYKYF